MLLGNLNSLYMSKNVVIRSVFHFYQRQNFKRIIVLNIFTLFSANLLGEGGKLLLHSFNPSPLSPLKGKSAGGRVCDKY